MGITHLDSRGKARMVGIGDKNSTDRTAVATGVVRMRPDTLRLISDGAAPKGDVLAAARIAGIMAAKKAPELVPLCHNILINSIQVDVEPDESSSSVKIRATVSSHGKTGVEIEALTAVSVAAITVYDMLKAVDRGMVIHDVKLVEKKGGKSGHYLREIETAKE